MKCLSVCQPFAELIVSGKKIIELRSWKTKFRGEFLIHAPQKIMINDCKRLGINTKLPVGVIVGKAEIYDIKHYETEEELKKDSKKHLASIRFHENIYGFILKNPKRFRIPIPTKGRLGFFEVKIPKIRIAEDKLRSEIIDEEYRYQWIGHH